MEGFKDFIWDVVRAWDFSPGEFFKAVAKYFLREVLRYFGVVGPLFSIMNPS